MTSAATRIINGGRLSHHAQKQLEKNRVLYLQLHAIHDLIYTACISSSRWRESSYFNHCKVVTLIIPVDDNRSTTEPTTIALLASWQDHQNEWKSGREGSSKVNSEFLWKERTIVSSQKSLRMWTTIELATWSLCWRWTQHTLHLPGLMSVLPGWQMSS